MERKKIISFIGNGMLNLFFFACIAFVILMLIQVFCFTSFKIPSDSMEPVLKSGDRIVVNKLIRGARLFDVMAALNHEDINIYRMPALGKFERNDVLVFNFPYQHDRQDSISFDVMQYYVKRCVAIPGDTLEIRNGLYKIRGVDKKLGNQAAQRRISMLTDSTSWGVVMAAFPWNGKYNWSIQEFGPLPVPRRGQEIRLDSMTAILYRQLISWEQKKKLKIKKGKVFLGDSLINNYRFLENYYFMAGDKAENSQDSRYWGLLPEPYIVGKATFIWKSVDKNTGKIRWNRIFKGIE